MLGDAMLGGTVMGGMAAGGQMVGDLRLIIALAAPLLIATWLLKGDGRRFTAFFLMGMGLCFAALYINAFLEAVTAMGAMETAVKLMPISEEILKALPVLFYFAVFSPKQSGIVTAATAVGLGFAMLENVHFLMMAGEANLWFSLIRGFAAGVMHTVCGAILGVGLAMGSGRLLSVPIAFVLLCLTATIHAIYNLFMVAGGVWAVLGYILPYAIAAALLIVMQKSKQDDRQITIPVVK
ncbi:MAG: PrsW family intramembrane metalloprotease [Clostridiales bacterium]|nr:PrsW family intramembrane metalloprotease [Clostridiales bacterium]